MATILTLDPADTPANGEVLVYDSTAKKWLPKPAPSGGGGSSTGYARVGAQTGTTYSAVAADAGALVTLNNTSGITVTLPADAGQSIPVGGVIDFAVLNVGMATFQAASGATVSGTPSLVTRARYSAVSAVKTAANTWLLIGDLA